MDDEKQLGGVHLGKKVQRLKEKRRLKEKAIANGTYNKRGKTMTCIKCKGQMLVWEKDRFGHAKAIPCPLCNKSGQNVAKKLAEIRRLNNDSKI